jgi:hypothetical protein
MRQNRSFIWLLLLWLGVAQQISATIQSPVPTDNGKTYVDEPASVVWNFNTTDIGNADVVTPADGFSLTAVNTGDLEITGTARRTADDLIPDVTFVKFRPSGSSNAVEWQVKPAAGLRFTPTKVSAYIQRFGTDAQNGVTVSGKLSDGTLVELGNYTAPRANHDTTKDKYAGNSNYTNQFVIVLSPEQQEALTSADGFSLVATVGVGSSKEGGFSDVHIEGRLNGTIADVEKFSLSIGCNPEEAGIVTAYPNADEYEAGTDVTLTATKNFGYRFVNWTDAEGKVVSEENKFVYTVSKNAVLTANFQKINTYELSLTVDGTNDYMVQMLPAPTIIDGKMWYEEGDFVTLTANSYEGLVSFTNWSDGQTSSEIGFKMNDNVVITAFYSQADIIAGWDFYKSGGNGRTADFFSEDNSTAALSLVNENNGSTSGWLDKSTESAGGYEAFKGAAVNWREGSAEGDVGHYYWYTKINAEAFSDIRLSFQMLYNYNAYTTYDVEYSLNGNDWVKFGSITMQGAKNAASFNGALPAEANNQKELHIRWIADKNSQIDGSKSANDGNAIAMIFLTGTPKLIDDGKAPVLISTVPVDGAKNASSNGKVVLTFDEKVKVEEGTVAFIGNLQLTPVVNGKTITCEYKGLEYSTEYTFSLPANQVGDLTGNLISEPIELKCSTMNRPAVEKGLYDVVVATTEELVAAINAANNRANKSTRFRIFIKNGTYSLPLNENVMVEGADGKNYPDPKHYIKASNISFIGESMEGTIITNAIPDDWTFVNDYGTASVYEGIGRGDVLQLQKTARNLYFQDLTVKSGIGDARGRNIAVQDIATMTIYKNTCLWGYQDTWTSNNDAGLYYFENGKVRGRTDFLCGKGDAYFNNVDIQVCMNTGGYIAVPSRSIKYGYVFKDCTIKGESANLNGKYTLGRPWGSGTPIALWIDTRMEIVPSAVGWSEMSNGWPKRFAEYNSMTATGAQVDLSGRKTIFGDGHANNPVLTAEEAAEAAEMSNMYGDWNPKEATEQAPVPTHVVISGNTLSWDNSNYALLWAIVKDGKVVDFTTVPSYTVDDANATYAVRAANEMGGLSEAALAETQTGIDELEKKNLTDDNAVYNLQGVRVQRTQQGIYIINGRKVVKK